MYVLGPVNVITTGALVGGFVRVVSDANCRLPVLALPILPAIGLATASARVEENSLLMVLAEVLKGVTKKLLPLTWADPAVEFRESPSIVGKLLVLVAELKKLKAPVAAV